MSFSREKKFDSMRNEHLSADTMTNTSTPNIDSEVNLSKKKTSINLTVPETNILDQIPGYNYETMNMFVQNLQQEYNNQLRMNDVMESENYESNIEKIKDFVSSYKSQVETQTTSLEKIVNDLKYIINKNKELHEERVDYHELTNSHEARDVAIQLRKMRSLKTEILHFLQETGIHTNHI